MQDKKITLDDFFVGRSVTPINSKDDVKRNGEHYLYVGSNWCGHSQLGTAHFSEACQTDNLDGEPRECYGLDLAKDGGHELAQELGLPDVRGVPALFKYNGEKYDLIASGRRMSHQYADLFNESEGL